VAACKFFVNFGAGNKSDFIMITPKLKDCVLKCLLSKTNISPDAEYSVPISMSTIADECGTKTKFIRSIIVQFNELNLIESSFNAHPIVLVSAIKADAYDLISRGGFVVKEELLEKEIKKLLLEIESLKSSFPEKAERFTSIIAGISTAFGIIIKS